MLFFRDWLNETVSFGKAKDVRRRIRKGKRRHGGGAFERYKPGTFGFEIEMREEDDLDGKMDDIGRMLRRWGEYWENSKATHDTWGIYEDESEILEVATRHMTTKDFPLIRDFLAYISDEEFDVGTGAHVHVGLPEDTDAFDLIALTVLPDESSVAKATGGGREFEDWSQMNVIHHRKIYDAFENGEYTNFGALGILRSISNKYYGTNYKPFFRMLEGKPSTIEFRYLSSDIVHKGDKFLEWIQYYLMMPYLARRKKQVKINTYAVKEREYEPVGQSDPYQPSGDSDRWVPQYKSRKKLAKSRPDLDAPHWDIKKFDIQINPKAKTRTITFTRMPDGGIRVDKDTRRVKQPEGSPLELRQSTGLNYAVANRVMQDYGYGLMRKIVPILPVNVLEPIIRMGVLQSDLFGRVFNKFPENLKYAVIQAVLKAEQEGKINKSDVDYRFTSSDWM